MGRRNNGHTLRSVIKSNRPKTIMITYFKLKCTIKNTSQRAIREITDISWGVWLNQTDQKRKWSRTSNWNAPQRTIKNTSQRTIKNTSKRTIENTSQRTWRIHRNRRSRTPQRGRTRIHHSGRHRIRYRRKEFRNRVEGVAVPSNSKIMTRAELDVRNEDVQSTSQHKYIEASNNMESKVTRSPNRFPADKHHLKRQENSQRDSWNST